MPFLSPLSCYHRSFLQISPVPVHLFCLNSPKPSCLLPRLRCSECLYTKIQQGTSSLARGLPLSCFGWLCVLVAQSYLTLCDTMNCSPPGFSLWNSPGKNIGVDCHSFLQRIFLTHGWICGLLHHRQILYCLSLFNGSQRAPN